MCYGEHLNRQPLNKLDRFALEYCRWRGLAQHDNRGAPWHGPGSTPIFSHEPFPFWWAIRAAWGNTKHWKPNK